MKDWIERLLNALFGPAGESTMEAEQRQTREDLGAWQGARGLQARARWTEQNHDGRDL